MPRKVLTSSIPDTHYLREAMKYPGPDYPMLPFMMYTDYNCQKLKVDVKTAAQIGQQRGYFQPIVYPSGLITRVHERINGGWLLWMSNTPMEVDSHRMHVANARGIVVVCGLGMGMVAYAMAAKPEVEHVFVIERNQFLIHHFPKFANGRETWRKKVTVLRGDVLESQFDLPSIDYMYVDTWAELFDPVLGIQHTRSAYENLLKGSKPAGIGMWGQEGEFLSWCAGKEDEYGYDTYTEEKYHDMWIEEMGLPFMIGPGGWDHYARSVKAVADTLVAQGFGRGDGFSKK